MDSRRSFLARCFSGLAAVAVAPFAGKAKAEPPKVKVTFGDPEKPNDLVWRFTFSE